MRRPLLFFTIAVSVFVLAAGCGRKTPQSGESSGMGARNPDSARTSVSGSTDSLRGSGAADGALSTDGRIAALMDTTLAPGRAGAIHVRTPVDSVFQAYGRSHIREVDLQLEGTPSPALEILLPGGTEDNPSLVAELDASRRFISRIRVYDSRFRTGKGIGPGATLRELRKEYRVDEIAQGEGNTVAIVRSLGMSFVLDSSVIPQEFYRSGNPKLIPESAHIVTVFVL